MTVKVEASHDGVPHNTVMCIGIVISLASLYLAICLGELSAFLGGIAAIGALIWGNSTIKRLCSYGIGTGVPSAGMLAFGSGVIAMLFVTKFASISPYLVPIVGLIIALIVGLILGWISNSVLNMKIPVMTQSISELAGVGCLTLMGFVVVATGKLGSIMDVISTKSSNTLIDLSSNTSQTIVQDNIVPTTPSKFIISFGIIAVAFMLGAIALQHPFNACLGPGEKQDRTNMLAIECGFLSMIIMSIISFAIINAVAAVISLVIAIVGWYLSYKEYFELSKRDAAAWLDAKPFEDTEK
ncbi:MAG TPA: tetrahydromethanopterin S-methyltransferase subunit C [Methanocorpusculum sp.]|nr:tetrahydromethanopterin S-methyltransferase subunit C [Methanocorpusculum sp.]